MQIYRSLTICIGLFLCVHFFSSVIDIKMSRLNIDRAQKSDSQITTELREKQLDCLTKNIYWEAANEPFEGKVAVAQVTLNRSNHKSFPKGICEVVYQKNIFYEKVVCQFSWYCETNYKIKAVNKIGYDESYKVAKKVLLEGFKLEGLEDALFYHATYISPNWRKKKIAVIGLHVFYE